MTNQFEKNNAQEKSHFKKELHEREINADKGTVIQRKQVQHNRTKGKE